MAIKWRIKGSLTYGSDATRWEELSFDDAIGLILSRTVELEDGVIEVIRSVIGVMSQKVEGNFVESEGTGPLFSGAGISSVRITTYSGLELVGNPAEVNGSFIRLIDTAEHFYLIPTIKIIKIVPVF